MAATHAPGPGVGPERRRHARQASVVAALAVAAVVVPFGLHDLAHRARDAATAPATASPPTSSARQRPAVDPRLGSHGDLPALLPTRGRLTDGTHVRLGDVTTGVLRRTPDGGWQVLVRWDGRLQPVVPHAPRRVGPGSSGPTVATWVSRDGLLYTRVVTSRPGRFRVYEWEPRGGTAYSPPALIATPLGPVCFNHAFTAFGDCRPIR